MEGASLPAFLLACLLAFSTRHVAGDDLSPGMSVSLRPLAAASMSSFSPQYTEPKGITYKGGPVMEADPLLYIVWYGDWSALNSSKYIIKEFLLSMGRKNPLRQGGNTVRGLYSINLQYSDSLNEYVKPNIVLSRETYDAYSSGTSFLETAAADILQYNIFQKSSGRLPLNGNAIYLIFTSPDVQILTQDGTDACGCGWRGYVGGGVAKYALIPNNAVLCADICDVRSPSANGNPAADNMVAVASWAVASTVTDPLFTTWSDEQGLSNGDKCIYKTGKTLTTATGAAYNVVGRRYRKFLAYQTWDLTVGACTIQGSTVVNRTNIGTYLSVYEYESFQAPMENHELPRPGGGGCLSFKIPMAKSFVIQWNVKDGRTNHVGCKAVRVYSGSACDGARVDFDFPEAQWDPLNFAIPDTTSAETPCCLGAMRSASCEL